MELPLLNDAFVQDFQRGTSENMADMVEQSLLLPKDMADLRSMRLHEVLLRLKRDLAMVSKFLTVLLFLSRPSKLLLGLRRW